MTHLDNIICRQRDSVDRLHAPDPDMIRTEYVSKRKPVVISGTIDHWNAFRLWEPEYLKSIAGDKRVTISYLPDNALRNDPNKGFVGKVENKPLRKYIDEMMEETGPRRPSYLAEQLVWIVGWSGLAAQLPELDKDIEEPAYLRGMRRLLAVMFWMSATEPTTSLHYDRNDNFLTQIRGRKRIILFPPSQSRLLYPLPIRSKAPHMSYVDVDRPDVTRYPRCSRASGMEVDLDPGEMLYIPAFWWHHVKSYDLNMALSFWYSNSIRTYTDLLASESAAYYWMMLPHMFVAQQIRRFGPKIKRRLFALVRKRGPQTP